MATRPLIRILLLTLLLVSCGGAAAQAPGSEPQESKQNQEPADPDTGESSVSEKTLGLLPNPFEQRGIKFALSHIGDVAGDISGGLRRGSTFMGRLNANIDVDLEKALGLQDLTFHANAFQIHGHGLSRNYVLNFMSISSIEALDTTRLYELWLEQKFDHDRFAVRLGQMAADTEFINSRFTDVFMNGTFGWPAMLGINLPAGGPSPPLAVMGVRVRAELSENVTVLTGLYDGNSAGPGISDPQARNRYGLNFRVGDAPLLLSEVQLGYDQSTLPGILKLGVWRHFGMFDDLRYATNGFSLASPNSSGQPAQVRGDFGVYGVLEQSLFRIGNSTDREIGFFARSSVSPSDRNLIDFYADAGINIAGMISARAQDKIGLGVAFARVSSRARDLDRDFQAFQSSSKVRDHEALVTLSYLAAIRDGWALLPTVQYVMHPAGGMTDPTGPLGATPLKNAAVLAVRSVLKF